MGHEDWHLNHLLDPTAGFGITHFEHDRCQFWPKTQHRIHIEPVAEPPGEVRVVVEVCESDHRPGLLVKHTWGFEA